jgi:hypothetical protein
MGKSGWQVRHEVIRRLTSKQIEYVNPQRSVSEWMSLRFVSWQV